MIEVKLSHDEMFKAVFQYVRNNYPSLKADVATLHYKQGQYGATVKCKYVNIEPEENPFMPRKEG